MEIEVKARAPAGVEQRLAALGAKHLRSVRETNTIYNSVSRDFSKTNEVLRVRQEDNRLLLTYKKTELVGGVKRAVEYETEVGDAIHDILCSAGVFKDIVYHKTRDYYSFRGAEVAVDSVDELGEFVEVELREGTEDDLFSILSDLGASPEDVVRDTYPGMMRKLKESGGA
ncbi:MAG: class IV adenylate cyclase [Candidatus Diapherotrites archaeon]|nr:class IV adenylate cyclase [Candidatus Diapherotrites archaeon]